MKYRASKHRARVDKVAAGFTIIETILFLAIAAMVFTGVIIGTNGAIRRQRYKDTVQSFVDDLRDLYSLAQNTEVLNYSGKVTCALKGDGTLDSESVDSTNSDRGRSDCSVYGVIARLQMNSAASTGSGENLQAYWLIGADEKSIKTDDYSNDAIFLNKARAKTYIKISGADQKIEAKKTSLYWGAQLSYTCENLSSQIGSSYTSKYNTICPTVSGKLANYAKYDTSNMLYAYLMVYRSPITGAIRTKVFFSEKGDLLDSANDLPLTEGEFDAEDDNRQDLFSRREVQICVTAGDGMSYDGGLRMITIKRDAGTMNDVILVEADSEENKCN